MAGLFVVVLALVAIYWFWIRSKRTFNRPLTVQEMIGAASNVEWEGLAQNQNQYRLVVEVEPINLDHASVDENKTVWINFLSLINTISLPYKLITQSQLFEMKDYMDDYQQSIEELPEEYSLLKKSGEMVSDYLMDSMNQQSIRNHHGYIIFEYNPMTSGANVQVGSSKLNGLLDKAAPRKERLSAEERSDLALQMLEEAEGMLYGFCEQVGMRYQRLDKAGVWNYTYQTLQRELAPQARMIDALHMDSFNRMKHSLTMNEIQSESNLV